MGVAPQGEASASLGDKIMRRSAPASVAAIATTFAILGVVVPVSRVGADPSPPPPPPDSGELLYATEGNRLRRIDVDTIGTPDLVHDVLVASAADDPEAGTDMNGTICDLGGGRFLNGEDTGQPNPPAGWGVFDADGSQVGKLTATYFTDGPEPHGCAVAPDGSLFTTEVGNQFLGGANGQLIQWFAPFDHFPGPEGVYPDTDATSENFCKIATDIGTAGGTIVDDSGSVYVASSRGLEILRFDPPFPTSPDAAGGCGALDKGGAPMATDVNRRAFVKADLWNVARGMLTFSGLAFAPNGNIYAASVITGRIGEYDTQGNFVRFIVKPPQAFIPVKYGTPQGLAVGGDGTLYYADLDVSYTPPLDFGPGPNGRVWQVRFDDEGDPLEPEVVMDGLAFPDGVAIMPGNLQDGGEPPPPGSPTEWTTYAGGPDRLFRNDDDPYVTSQTVGTMRERWRFNTDAIITASPAVAAVDVPGEGVIQVAFFASWDLNIYAVRLSDGSELWRFKTPEQPGAGFPAAASVDVSEVDAEKRVHLGVGETFFALDAATGAERWRFEAGTGCRDSGGEPPGLCGFDAERNEIESSAVVAEGKVFFGMDVNDGDSGKGGFYALDAHDGTLAWFFDLNSGQTCYPDPGDEVRNFDGYHSEAELGLPAGFFATRSGCDFEHEPTGCSNVWSSPAYDAERSTIYYASSNCDTDDDPETAKPEPPMPDWDEAIIAQRTDGTPLWRWRPREVDNDDLAFGGVPNLFAIETGAAEHAVVGVGNKDGTYYVVDRDTGDPVWSTKVVPGGKFGGIIATASADQENRRIYFSTASGFDPLKPQQPTMHTLDMDTGEIVWQTFGQGLAFDASYSPTSSVNDVAFTGSVVTSNLRGYATGDGELIFQELVGNNSVDAVASGAVVVDGTLLVGTGVGSLSEDTGSPGSQTAFQNSALVALCVPGAPGCVDPPPPCHGSAPTITGTAGPDLIEGTSKADVISGLGGNDWILAGEADDIVCGGPGSDLISAGFGADLVDGESGSDIILGDAGDDALFGSAGADLLNCAQGVDTADGGGGFDLALGCETQSGIP